MFRRSEREGRAPFGDPLSFQRLLETVTGVVPCRSWVRMSIGISCLTLTVTTDKDLCAVV
jgi:hypothetical protein